MNMATKESKVTLWQIAILILSMYVLIALFIETTVRLPDETSSLLLKIDNMICFILIGDFLFRLYTEKLTYLKLGWIDLISSIPNLQILRWGRLVRAVRIIRILRSVRSTKKIYSFLFKNKAQGTLFTVSVMSFVLMIFSSIAILNIETAGNSNIKTAGDALWWSFVTITTVGYGDHYPVTGIGRMIATILMVAGVGLFGTFTAYIASLFVGSNENNKILQEIQTLREEIQSTPKV